MDDTIGFPGVIHGFCNLDHQRQKFRQGEFLTAEPFIFKRTALHQFHGKIVFAGRRTAGINSLNDIRMIQPGGKACLPQKFFDKIRIFCKFRLQNFQSDLPVHAELECIVNNPHIPRPDLVDEAEIGDCFTGTVMVGIHFSLLRAALKNSLIRVPASSARTPPVTGICQSIPGNPVISSAEPQQPLRGSGRP